LFSEDGDERHDYTAGLLFIACTIISFFTVWGFIILLLKCLGPFRVGVFSGYPYQVAGTATSIGRGVFLFSSMMVMLFSTLAISQGLTKLQDTADTIDAVNQDMAKVQAELKQLTHMLRSRAQSALPIRDQLVDVLKGDICPLLPNAKEGLRQDGLQTLDSLTDLEDFLAGELTNVTQSLRQVAHASEEVKAAVEDVEFTSGGIAAVMILFFIVPSLLAVSLLMGWTETYYDAFFTCTECFTMPVFVVMIIFAYVSSGFIVMATEANADFCAAGYTPTPESTILNIMGRYNLHEGDLYYDAVKFYSQQCSVKSPFEFLETYYDNLVAARGALAGMETTIISASPSTLSMDCGQDYSATLEVAVQLQAHIDILRDTAKRSLELLSCSSIVPLYTNSINKGVCEENMAAALWLFSCSLFISFFGMLMITLRGACYPLLIWDDEKDLYSTESSGAGSAANGTGDDEGTEQDVVDFLLNDVEGTGAPSESLESYEEDTR
jgi:hypothetical protein